MMLGAIGLILLGLLLLVLGGEALLRGAVALATLLRMTPAVIGLTVVAFGTSVPELAVSVTAAIQEKPDITVGNVVGSNIFNIACILGISALLRPLVIGGNTIRFEYPVLVLVTLLCLALGQDEKINWLDAALMLCVYAGFTAFLVGLVREQMSRREEEEFRAEVQELAERGYLKPSLPRSLLLVAAGIGLLGAGAHITVLGAVQMAEIFGMSERVIGLTIIGAGTGLPELVTSLVSCYRGRDDVAVANVIGSNMFNILGILGISGLIAPLSFHPSIMASDCWWMLAVTIGLFPLMFTGRRISRLEGFVLLAVYVAYIVQLLLRQEPAMGPS